MTLKGREGKWTERFNKVIERTGVADEEINDPTTKSKLFQKSTWNWYAAFLGPYYAAYHNIQYWGFYVVLFSAMLFLDAVILNYEATLIISIIFFWFFGAYGNALVLLRTVEKDRKPPVVNSKLLRLAISILVIFSPMPLELLLQAG